MQVNPGQGKTLPLPPNQPAREVRKSPTMSDEPKRRPILSLKNPPKVVAPELFKPAPAAAPPPPPAYDWKCKPCGAGFSVDAFLTDEVVIRCSACNAKLGTVAEFRADPPPARLRARPVKKP